MKKIPIYFLLVALLAALTGCGGSETPAQTPTESTPPPAAETQGAIPGDIDAARAAYAALSESDQQQFFAEIAADQETRAAARREALKGRLYGEWRMEYDYSGPHYALKLVLNEDMTFEYGKFSILEDFRNILNFHTKTCIRFVRTVTVHSILPCHSLNW